MKSESVRQTRREAAIDLLADHLLAEGLSGSNLRALAAAAGTSDRMLLYYFASKDDLLTAALERIAARMSAMLDAALPAEARLPPEDLLRALWPALESPDLRPFMRLWLELAAGSARGEQPHKDVAGRIIDGFVAWVAAHLDVREDQRAPAAARLLATVDGLLLLDAVGRGDLAAEALSVSN